MSDQDPVTGRPVTPPAAPTTTAGVPPVAPTSTTTGGGSGDQSKSDQAKVKAEHAKDMAKEKTDEARTKAAAAGGAVGEHAGNVTESAKAHATEVTEEAKRQASTLANQGVQQVRSQAEQQTDRAAEYLQTLGEQLRAASRGEKAPEGPVADLLQQGAQRVEDMAGRLRTGGLDVAMHDVQRFARRRPGTFLASAFGAGLIAGRLFKNVDTSQLTSTNGGGQQGVRSGAELDVRRGGVPAPATTTGTATTGLPGAPTMGAADPLVTGDPTGQLGGPR